MGVGVLAGWSWPGGPGRVVLTGGPPDWVVMVTRVHVFH